MCEKFPSGYQQGVLLAIGSYSGERFSVRCVERYYCDVVQPLFGTAVYLQRNSQPGRKDYFTVKSKNVSPPVLSEILDVRGFSRAYIEIHACLDLWIHWHDPRKRDFRIKTPRLRIYGQPDVLDLIMAGIPAAPKKMREIIGSMGATNCLSFSSPAEVFAILDWIDGTPRNESVWEKYNDVFRRANEFAGRLIPAEQHPNRAKEDMQT